MSESGKSKDGFKEGYDCGYRDALTSYAYWKDGEQLVGTCGDTLRQATDKRRESYFYSPRVWLKT